MLLWWSSAPSDDAIYEPRNGISLIDCDATVSAVQPSGSYIGSMSPGYQALPDSALLSCLRRICDTPAHPEEPLNSSRWPVREATVAENKRELLRILESPRLIFKRQGHTLASYVPGIYLLRYYFVIVVPVY